MNAKQPARSKPKVHVNGTRAAQRIGSTELGRRLYALRTKAVRTGLQLLSEEEVLESVKRRRGEAE